MNNINFSFPDGFPMTQKTLQDMQTSYQQYKYIAEAFGDKVIIGGCEDTGPEIKDGLVYYQSDTNDYTTKEVYFFKGGAKQNKVKVIQNITSKVFKDGNTKNVYTERYIEFASDGDINWSDFVRVKPLKDLSLGVPQMDEIRMFGSNKSDGNGWYRCDGNNRTIGGKTVSIPDLRRRFIVGHDDRSTSHAPLSQTMYDQIGKLSSLTGVDVGSNHSHYAEEVLGRERVKPSSQITISSLPSSDWSKKEILVNYPKDDGSGNKISTPPLSVPPYYVVLYMIYKGI